MVLGRGANGLWVPNVQGGIPWGKPAIPWDTTAKVQPSIHL